MDIVSNHIVQNFASLPMQNANKFVVNVNHSVPHTINHQIMNHTINNQNANCIKPNMIIPGNSDGTAQVVTVNRINELVREIDPAVQLDEEVEETLLQLTDDFTDHVIKGAIQLAKHRKTQTIEVKDVQLYLERSFNMWIPGFGTDELRPYKRGSLTESHKQRLALIRRAIKKY